MKRKEDRNVERQKNNKKLGEVGAKEENRERERVRFAKR